MKELKTLNELKREITNGNVILKVFTTWCGPCKLLNPQFEAAEKEMENVSFFTTNAEVATDIAKEFNVNTVPTVILFKNGKKDNTFVGFKTKDNIIDFIKQSIK